MSRITKDVAHAIEWLAAEFNYLRLLHKALERIEKEDLGAQDKELKKDLRVARYIGRAEWRVEHNIKNVLEDLEKAKSTEISPDEFNDLIKEIEIPANKLINEGSRYVGGLRSQLKSIRTDAKVAEKYPDEAHRQQIIREIQKLKSDIGDLERWIAALDAGLKKAGSLVEVTSKKPNHFEESEQKYHNKFCERPVCFHGCQLANLISLFETGLLSHEIFKRVIPFPIKGGGNMYQGPQLVCSYSMDMHYDFLKKYFIDYEKGNLAVVEEDMKKTDAVETFGHHILRELEYFKRYGFAYDIQTRNTMLKQCIFNQDPGNRRVDFPKSIDYSYDYNLGYTLGYLMFVPKKMRTYKHGQHLPWEVSFKGLVKPDVFIGLLYPQRAISMAKSKKIKDAAADLVSYNSKFFINWLIVYKFLTEKEVKELETEREKADKELQDCLDKHKEQFPRWSWDDEQNKQIKIVCKDAFEKVQACWDKTKKMEGSAAFLFLEKYFKVKLGDSTVYDVILLFCQKFRIMLVDDFGNILYRP